MPSIVQDALLLIKRVQDSLAKGDIYTAEGSTIILASPTEIIEAMLNEGGVHLHPSKPETFMLTDPVVNQIAEMCHEVNRAYCLFIGDKSLKPWDESPDWQKQSCMNGVRYHYDNPAATPESSHENWMAVKLADGWVWGPTKDEAAKTHPCIANYKDLPLDQRVKDHLFAATARTCFKQIRQAVE